jgi:ornithine carbamoyltransferase
MGEEAFFEERIRLLRNYQVNMDVLAYTGRDDCIFLHCLPAFHDTNTEIGQEIFEKYGLKDMEVSDQVFRSKHSKVFDQAENRVHTIKAVMVATLA